MNRISDNTVFHPKVYIFRYGRDNNDERMVRIIIGSGNLTKGGLSENHELSAAIKYSYLNRNPPTILRQFDTYIKDLIKRDVILLTRQLIDQYSTKYNLRRLIRAKEDAAHQADENIFWPNDQRYAYFKCVLQRFKSEEEDRCFRTKVDRRLRNRESALGILKSLCSDAAIEKESFSIKYNQLVSRPFKFWHSGLIDFTKKMVINEYREFVIGLSSLQQLLDSGETVSPSSAFEHLRSFYRRNGEANGVPGVGVNIMSEILHSYDNKSYAVMNKLSVSQLNKADTDLAFPTLLKGRIRGADYQRFCEGAARLSDQGNRIKRRLEFLATFLYRHRRSRLPGADS